MSVVLIAMIAAVAVPAAVCGDIDNRTVAMKRTTRSPWETSLTVWGDDVRSSAVISASDARPAPASS